MENNKAIITCKRTFPHITPKVLSTFLEAEKAKQWFGLKEFSIGEVLLEAMAGWKLQIEMITPKVDVLWVSGVYTTIIKNSSIAYKFTYEPDMPNLGETLVTFHFTTAEVCTEVCLVHTIYREINPAGRAKGW